MAIHTLPSVAEPAAAKLRSTPLRVKLLAAVLVLVFAALSLISVASTFALRTYLIGRMDEELQGVATFLTVRLEGLTVRQLTQDEVALPTE